MPIRSILPKTIALWSVTLVAVAAMAQQFQQPLVIATGSWPSGIEAADVNGDGKADLIYTDYGATPTVSTTHILLSKGDGTFSPGQTIATAGTSIAVADFNHDGHVDLAWVWGEAGLGKAYLALGNGDGTFAPARELGTLAIVGENAPQFRYVMGAQLHDTGYLDLLVEDAANPSLITLTIDESETLVRIVGTKLPSGVGPMAIADLNADGHTDLVIQSVTGGAADVFLGSADGLLTVAGAYTGSSAAQSMLLHDMDGDGRMDLVLENADGRIEIFRGNADGSFSTASEGGSGSADARTGLGGHLVAVMDIAGRNNLYSTTPTGMSVLLAQNDLSLTLTGIYNAGPGRTSFTVADFNGDGVQDVAVDSPEGVAILFGSAEGGLGSSRAFAAGQPALSGALGELSGSGNLDAVVNVSASQALLLHGNGDGTFAAGVTPTAQHQLVAATDSQIGSLPGAPQGTGLVQAASVTVDLDGDGNQDVIVAYDNTSADHAHPIASVANEIYLWYGNADGSFSAPVVLRPSRNFYQLTVADVNGDGRPDLVMSDGYVVSVQNNLGGRIFGAEAHFLAGMGINSITAGDVNKDGFTDLVAANGGTVIANPEIAPTKPDRSDVTTGGITVLLNTAKTKTVSGMLTVAPNATEYGETFTILAQVTPPASSPAATGAVTFALDGETLGSVPVSGGVASITVPGTTPIGRHALAATYSGSSTYNGVVLDGTHTVTGIPTTVVFILSTPSSIYVGQTVSGSAQVTASNGSTPTGTISFFDGAKNICTISVTQGASCPANAGSGFAVGLHSLTAVYSGDSTHQGSSSAPVTVTVLPLVTTNQFSISVTGFATTTVGGIVNLRVAVVPQAGYLLPVKLSCSDLPTEATCTFAAGTIPGGGGATTLKLRVMAPRSCEVADSETWAAGLPFAGTTLAALVVLLWPGKRRRMIQSLLVVVLAICGTASLTGCGACTDLGTKPGSYTIRVIGTEAGQLAGTVWTKVKVTVQD